jgi:hypothetical protein
MGVVSIPSPTFTLGWAEMEVKTPPLIAVFITKVE